MVISPISLVGVTTSKILKEYSSLLESKIKTLKFEIEEISLLQWRLNNDIDRLEE